MVGIYKPQKVKGFLLSCKASESMQASSPAKREASGSSEGQNQSASVRSTKRKDRVGTILI